MVGGPVPLNLIGTATRHCAPGAAQVPTRTGLAVSLRDGKLELSFSTTIVVR